MFSIPSLPTDNLYKLIFISSIILYIYTDYRLQGLDVELSKDEVAMDSAKFTQREINRVDSIKNIEMKKTLNQLDLELNLLEKEESNLSKQKKIPTAQYRLLATKLAQHKEKRTALYKTADSLMTKLNEDRLRALIDESKVRNRIAHYKLIINDSNIYKWLSGLLFTIGSLGWLFLVQNPQDKLTKLTIQLTEAQLKKALREESDAKSSEPETDSEQTT